MIPCPLCRGAADQQLGQMALSRIGEVEIRRCAKCSVMFSHPLPSPEALRQCYASEYLDAKGKPAGYFNYVRDIGPARLRDGRELGATLSFVPGRLLEIGCCTGHFIKGVADASNWEVHGLEISEEAAEYGRTRLGVEIAVGNIEGVDLADSHYDIICVNDVLQHLVAPQAALAKLYLALKPGGKIQLVMPDGSFDVLPFVREAKAGGTLVSPHWHLFFFPQAAIRRTLAETGFRVMSAERSMALSALVDLGLFKPARGEFDRKSRGLLAHPRRRSRVMRALLDLLERVLPSLGLGHESGSGPANSRSAEL
ncbi:MAG: class I SAM-dependent methyltransferase [Gammaproteobacteria bacterium]|nr:class I SAM-dependent methyltransferase [Gammaproteobacteria bacterium]